MSNVTALTNAEFKARIKFRNDEDQFCCNCYHWWAIEKTFGQCRCYAPTLIDKEQVALWPETSPNQGCSDFTSLEDDDDEGGEWVIVQN